MQATNLIIASSRRNSEGYPEAWYPVALLKDLKSNTPKLITLAGKEWVLFCTHDNVIGCISRYCPHMGADLMNGKFHKNGLTCALHGWTFDNEGRCLQYDDSSLHSLHCDVMCGVIFAYWGHKPHHDLPEAKDSLLSNLTHIQPLAATHHVVSLNTFDLQHYRRIHHRKIIGAVDVQQLEPRILRIKMTTQVLTNHWTDWLMEKLTGGQMQIEIDCWSTGILMMKNLSTGYGAIVAIAPLHTNSSQVFITPVISAEGLPHWKKLFYQVIALPVALVFVKTFLSPDIKVLSGMRPVEGDLQEGIDDVAKRYWQFYRDLPRYAL